MRLSIILPCLNEIRHGYLNRILTNLDDQLIPNNWEKEIIAVVSASDDQTELVLDEFALRSPHTKVVRSLAKNRALRLNDGIAISRGDIILLHHPATLLPEIVGLQLIEQALETGKRWGAFGHSFDLEHPLLRFTSWYSDNVRVKHKGIVYLDHCPFIERQVLNQIGNVPDLDIFEDTVLSDRLVKFSKPALAKGKVVTSARRFRQRGIYRHALLNQILKLCYLVNIDPKHLNRLYEKSSSINTKY